MNDPNAFSYSFSFKPAPKQPAPDTELFAVDRLSRFALNTDQLLARSPRTGGELVMPGEHFRTLVAYCSAFRSLDEHVAELMEGSDGSAERAGAIRQVVQAFRDQRLTLSAQDICRELAPVTGAGSIPDKPVVVIITCDRPRTLERLLNSMLENCDLDAIDRCLVVDDSRAAEHGARNRASVEAAAQRCATNFQYFGAAEAGELVGALIRQLPQHQAAIRFLLDRERWKDRESFGVARNFSHLLSVGKPVVVFDDDTLCEAFCAPFPAEGFAFTAGQREAVFYADHEEWRQGVERCSHDPVVGHMQCLGLTLPEALSVLGASSLEQAALRSAPVDFASRLRRDSRVLITECGAFGEPGTGTNTWLATLPAASRERLARADGRLRLALKQRCCWLGHGQPVFRPHGSMSQVTGFDNRHFLPPYFPVTRGEDRLLGQMTHYIYPNSVVLDYPWAVPHIPLEERDWTAIDNNFQISPSFPGLLTDDLFATTDVCLATDPQDRLAYLARLFEDLASAPDAALLERLTDSCHRHRSSQMRKLQLQIRESAELTVEWRTYLEEALEQVQSSRLNDFRTDTLTGNVGSLQGQELLNFWKDAWRGFGRSLPAWREIREAAAGIVA